MQGAEPETQLSKVGDPLRIGVIAVQAGDESSQLAEAKAVILLQGLGAQAVERVELDRVLGEQSLTLSALTDPASALRFGVALRADALLILEPNEKRLHARVMDTRHGVILGEALLDINQSESFVNTLEAILTRVLQKVSIPAAEMVYVSVMGVTASADVEVLKAAAGQMGPLIRADLQAIPRVRIVEREQLALIQREIRLAGGEANVYGSAIVIEGELRPVDNGRRAELAIIITDQAKQKSASIKAEPTEPEVARLRASARSLIARHLALVQAEKPIKAGPAEAAAILARTHWRVMHQDYSNTEGRIEAALLIDDSLDRLDEAWWIYYQISHGNSRLHSEAPLDDGRIIRAIRRHHELKFSIMRHPSNVRSFQNDNQLYPIHYEMALVLAETNEHRDEIGKINRTTDEWFELAMADRRARGESIVPLLKFRLRKLVLAVNTPEAYMSRAKDFIVQIRSEASADDWDRGDPAVTPFRDNFHDFYGYPGHHDLPYVPFTPQEVKPLFDWMLTQDDPGLRILAQWYRMGYGSEDDQVQAAAKMLELLFETAGFHNPGNEEIALSINGYYPEFPDDAMGILYARGQLGNWFDGLLSRAERSRSIDSLLNWYDGDIIQMVDLGDDDAVKHRRLNYLVKLIETYGNKEEDAFLIDELLASTADLREKFADDVKHRDVNLWDEYDARLITLKGMDGEMRKPAAYLITGDRGDTDRQLYIAWYTDQEGQWAFTRCALRGGDLKHIGKAHVRPSKNWGIHNAVMVSCNGYLVLGGVGELLVLSEKDGSSTYYGTKQGLPGSYIQSLAVIGDRVMLGGKNGLTILDPATGRLDVIANALAVEAKSPLDHTAPYRVSSIMTLEGYNRVWFLIEGNEARAGRGPWQYDMETGEITRVEGSDGGPHTWKFRGDILAIHTFKSGFFRLDPDTNKLVPYEFPYDYKPWHYILKNSVAPVIVGDHLFAHGGSVMDVQGRDYRRYDGYHEWSYIKELDDESVCIGYSDIIWDTRQPDIWLVTRKP